MKKRLILPLIACFSMNGHTNTTSLDSEKKEQLRQLNYQLEQSKSRYTMLRADYNEAKSQANNCRNEIQCQELKGIPVRYEKSLMDYEARIKSLERRIKEINSLSN